MRRPASLRRCVGPHRCSPRRGAFDSLISDLHASNLERRARSSITRDSRATGQVRPGEGGRKVRVVRPAFHVVGSGKNLVMCGSTIPQSQGEPLGQH